MDFVCEMTLCKGIMTNRDSPCSEKCFYTTNGCAKMTQYDISKVDRNDFYVSLLYRGHAESTRSDISFKRNNKIMDDPSVRGFCRHSTTAAVVI